MPVRLRTVLVTAIASLALAPAASAHHHWDGDNNWDNQQNGDSQPWDQPQADPQPAPARPR